MTNNGFPGFPPDCFEFLKDLRDNNQRDWFAAHKERYEQSVLEPALALIRCLERPLAKAAPLLRVEAKKMGGSLMRIYKDTRFSKDKTPYKTNIGIQFRHQLGRDVHAPGVYLHIAPDECFLGVGTWRPPSDSLKKIREYIVHHESGWRKVLANKKFRESFSLYEDRLKSVPRGYDKQHPLIDQLRQQSFLGTAPLSPAQIQSPELSALIPKLITAGKPFMLALCEALEQPW
jgi:uncharacterized protein (TIGR02453 family)